MSNVPTTPYHEMPGERLTLDVQRKATELAQDGAENLDLFQVGYFMRSYAGMFNGSGPLSNEDAWEQLPETARDSIINVGQKSLDLLTVSTASDAKPVDITNLFNYIPDPDLTEREDLRSVLHSVQVSLEMVNDPNKDMRRYTEANDMLVLSGQHNPTTDGPLRTSWGTTLVTREAALELLKTAANEFGNVFGGCEMVLPDDAHRRDEAVHYIASIVGSTFRNPAYPSSNKSDFI